MIKCTNINSLTKLGRAVWLTMLLALLRWENKLIIENSTNIIPSMCYMCKKVAKVHTIDRLLSV